MSLTVARDTLERAPLPGDVFLLNWPRLGIDQMVVRVTGIDTGTLGAAEWRIEAMEDVFGLATPCCRPRHRTSRSRPGTAAARLGAGGRDSVLGTGAHACRVPIWIT
jgi:hypothetical protein